MAAKAISATGRRKTSSARVFIKQATASDAGKIVVNGRTFEEYFPRPTTQMIIHQPLELTERMGKYHFRISVVGGGKSGQAGAVLQGVSRALLKVEPALRSVLKKGGFLTRDARKVERKKAGRHKARKRPQYSKR